jgi:hypothetical protein
MHACILGDAVRILKLLAQTQTSIITAINDEDLSACRVLFGWGADLSRTDAYGMSLLHISAERGNLSQCSQLVAREFHDRRQRKK